MILSIVTVIERSRKDYPTELIQEFAHFKNAKN